MVFVPAVKRLFKHNPGYKFRPEETSVQMINRLIFIHHRCGNIEILKHYNKTITTGNVNDGS